VRRCPSGYFAFGTPFGPTRSKRGVNVGARVAGIYFLEQGGENRLEPVPEAAAMRLLLRSVRFFSDREMAAPEQARMARSLFVGADRFLRETPAHRLVFTREPRVWELLQ
jgi:hypothetical protein